MHGRHVISSESCGCAGSVSVSTAANSAIYAGLKFTGLALTVAADLAKSVRKDLTTAQEERVSRCSDLT
jgi:hypothetical protein